MKRTLAMMTAAAMLTISLAGCGDTSARTGDLSAQPNGTTAAGTTATDTMRNDNGVAGTGTTSGASTGTNPANSGLGSAAGAVGRSFGTNSGSMYANGKRGGRDDSVSGYAYTGIDYSDETMVHRAAKAGDNYARMLENGRVHDTDGYLLDGENAHWNTF